MTAVYRGIPATSIAATAITGTIQDAQIAGVSGLKIIGTIPIPSIPPIDGSKIASGTVSASYLPALSSMSGTIPNSKLDTGIDASKLTVGVAPATAIGAHNHSGGDINVGTVPADRLPNLSSMNGQVGSSQISSLPSHNHGAADVNSGTLDAARIPSLDGSKIGSGTVSASYLPALNALSGAVGLTQIPDIFVSRGDHAVVDFTAASFTCDSTWRVLDLSSVVPAGAKAAIIRFVLNGAGANYSFLVTKFGFTNNYNIVVLKTFTIGIAYEYQAIVEVDSDRKIQYYCAPASWNALDVLIDGWIMK